MSRRALHWCFTVNNPQDGLNFDDRVRYAVWQLERGEQGTNHFQGYLRLKRAASFNAVRNLLPEGTHIEIARNPIAAEHYCRKEDSRIGGPFVHDQRDVSPRHGLLQMAASMPREEFFEHCVTARIPKGYYDEAIRLASNNNTTIVETEDIWLTRINSSVLRNYTIREDVKSSWVIVGQSGCGKTSWAKYNAPKPCLFVTHIDDLKHFKSSTHKSIIFDDMDFKHLPRTAQIHIVDVNDGRSIHVRYGTAYIPAGIRKIFLANEYPFIEDPAISRRVTLLSIN